MRASESDPAEHVGATTFARDHIPDMTALGRELAAACDEIATTSLNGNGRSARS